MDIRQIILRIISDLINVEEEDIPFSADLRNDLGINSLEGLTLIVNVEEVFHISIATQDIQNITTVGDIIQYVEYYLSK